MKNKIIAIVEHIKLSAHDVLYVTYHHHINNKLFALAGNIELLQMQISNPDASKEISVNTVNMMISKTKNIKNIIEKIKVEYSKRQKTSNTYQVNFSQIDLKGSTFIDNLATMHEYFEITHGTNIKKNVDELQRITKNLPQVKDEALYQRIVKIQKGIDNIIAVIDQIEKAEMTNPLEPYPGNQYTLGFNNN